MNLNKEFKASITVFVLILLGFTIGLYLMGFTSTFVSEFTADITDPSATAGDFLNSIGGAIISAFTENLEVVLPMLGFGLLAGFTGGAYAGGSILRFLIPVMLLFVVINIFIFPVVPAIQSEVTHAEAFSPIILVLTIILNAIMFLAIFEFVSGRD